ncbi:MAG: hypothetical protein M0Z44_07050 [Gammaproteobacteria bacterium]|nr:hypothetical protein [Gammaproteobacteria bacterium]
MHSPPQPSLFIVALEGCPCPGRCFVAHEPAQSSETAHLLSACPLDTIMRATGFRDEKSGAHIKPISFCTQDPATRFGMDRGFAATALPGDFAPRVLEVFRGCSDVFADIFSAHPD